MCVQNAGTEIQFLSIATLYTKPSREPRTEDRGPSTVNCKPGIEDQGTRNDHWRLIYKTSMGPIKNQTRTERWRNEDRTTTEQGPYEDRTRTEWRPNKNQMGTKRGPNEDWTRGERESPFMLVESYPGASFDDMSMWQNVRVPTLPVKIRLCDDLFCDNKSMWRLFLSQYATVNILTNSAPPGIGNK